MAISFPSLPLISLDRVSSQSSLPVVADTGIRSGSTLAPRSSFVAWARMPESIKSLNEFEGIAKAAMPSETSKRSLETTISTWRELAFLASPTAGSNGIASATKAKAARLIKQYRAVLVQMTSIQRSIANAFSTPKSKVEQNTVMKKATHELGQALGKIDALHQASKAFINTHLEPANFSVKPGAI